MSMQISHIVFGEQILQMLDHCWDRQAFLIGNVFPDIRYLARIDRAMTHRPMDAETN